MLGFHHNLNKFGNLCSQSLITLLPKQLFSSIRANANHMKQKENEIKLSDLEILS